MRRVTRAIESTRTQSLPKRGNWRRSERILVAVNLTEEGGELVTWALTRGSRSGDAVTVIYIVEPCPPLANRAKVTRWERQKKDMLNILSEVVTHCRTHYQVPHLSIVVQVVENDSVGDAIVKEARSLEATRVILGKHKSRRLDISLKRMTSLGSLCVQCLEPHCEVFIVRKGKVLIRKHGTAKTRRSLKTLLFNNTTQESSTRSSIDSEEADSTERQEGISQMDESTLGPKKSLFLNKSSSFGKSSRSSNSSETFSIIDSSRDSFSPAGSESSPRSVLKIFNKDSKSSQKDDDKIEGPGLYLRSTSLPFSQLSQGEWLKVAAPATHSRSRSSSNSLESVLELSLESVPELPEQTAEEMKLQDKRALVVFNPPQLEKRKDDSKESLAIMCVSQPEESEESRKIGEYLDALVKYIAPELEDVNPNEVRDLVLLDPPQLDIKKEARKEVFDRESEGAGAIVLSSFFPRELEDSKGSEEDLAIVLLQSSLDGFRWPGFSPLVSPLALKERKEEDGREDVRSGGCSPPEFARTCSAVKYNLSEDGLQSLAKDVILELPEVQRFSYEELRVATEDFSPKHVVGTGGASRVYKGQLTDGRLVAIKKLVDDLAGEKEFMMEMMMLVCTLNHPNLVTMLGFCAEGPHHLIAYELLSRGSLERNLHNLATSRKLNWEQRQKVAFGASRGLAYLHNFRPTPIVHRDIKTSNILVADDFEAQISDFGLARWVSEADTAMFDEQVSCAGTFGYLAPECLMYGGFNERTDIFAFGVVLLELISGRRPMDESLQDTSLVLWARTLQQNGRTHCLVDKSLKDINPQQFKRMMYTAFLCVQVSPEDRPTMDRVVRLLDPDCNYSPAILQPNISAPPFMSMPELGAERQQSPSPPSSPSYDQQSSSSPSSSLSSSSSPSSPSPSSLSSSSTPSPLLQLTDSSSHLQLALPSSPVLPSSPSPSPSSSPSSQLQLTLPLSPSPSTSSSPSSQLQLTLPSSPSSSSSSSPSSLLLQLTHPSSQLQLALPSSPVLPSSPTPSTSSSPSSQLQLTLPSSPSPSSSSTPSSLLQLTHPSSQLLLAPPSSPVQQSQNPLQRELL